MRSRNVLSLAAALSILTSVLPGAGVSAGPIGVSRTGRYFVAANSKPFIYGADSTHLEYNRGATTAMLAETLSVVRHPK